MTATANILQADARRIPLADSSIDCVVTSPPYWQVRDYGVAGQLGLEDSPAAYVAEIVGVFREIRRVLKPQGTVWLNLGDCYAGSGKGTLSDSKTRDGRRDLTKERHIPLSGDLPAAWRVPEGLKSKDLVGMPWRVAFALQADGWLLRADIIWHKPNPMPESVRDRPTKAHEYIFLFAKQARYYYDFEAAKEPCSENTHARVARQGLAGPNASWLGADFKGERDTARDQVHPATQGKPPRKPGVNPKAAGGGYGGDHRFAGLAASERVYRPRQNESFSAAIVGQVLKRNKRSVWTVGSRGYKGAHFATYPEALVEPCILAGCPAGGLVLDPFCGTGTTLAVATRLGRNAVGLELKPEYVELAKQRLAAAPKPAALPLLERGAA
jgi:DNA modification methylase